jgi:ferredoxin
VAAASAAPAETFEVECARSRVVLTIPADESILDLVQEKVDANYPYGCTEGFCGSCETKVLEGIPEHRDEILTDDERAANNVMMICVSRSKTPRLVLDV